MKYPDQDGNDARHNRRTEKQQLDRQARDTRTARRAMTICRRLGWIDGGTSGAFPVQFSAVHGVSVAVCRRALPL